MSMNVGSIPPVPTPDPTDPVANIKMKLQMSMLRKTLDAQNDEAATLMQMLEGKGQNIDIRA
jgi:hypothetical protein